VGADRSCGPVGRVGRVGWARAGFEIVRKHGSLSWAWSRRLEDARFALRWGCGAGEASFARCDAGAEGPRGRCGPALRAARADPARLPSLIARDPAPTGIRAVGPGIGCYRLRLWRSARASDLARPPPPALAAGLDGLPGWFGMREMTVGAVRPRSRWAGRKRSAAKPDLGDPPAARVDPRDSRLPGRLGALDERPDPAQ
jgi:hypothetical protein